MPSLQIKLSQHAFNATLAYLAAQWTQDSSVTVTVYPMRKVAQAAGLASHATAVAPLGNVRRVLRRSVIARAA